MKALIGRQRPPGAERYEPDLDKSFPSGHAMEGIYLYVATGMVLIHLGTTRGTAVVLLGRTLVVMGPFIGVSRLILGVHWPSDILAGWAFGSVVLLAWPLLILWSPVDRGWVRRAPTAPPGSRPPEQVPRPLT